MTDDKEDKTLEHQEHFTEVAKSRDVEVSHCVVSLTPLFYEMVAVPVLMPLSHSYFN